MNDEVMLTTIDNPYDPFTEFDKWNRFDEEHGYFTNNYVDRVMYNSKELSEADQLEAYNMAIDSILKLNITGKYIKVRRHKQKGIGEGS